MKVPCLILGLALFAAARAAAEPAFVVLTVPTRTAAGAAELPSLLADWRMKGLVSDAFLLGVAGPSPAFSEVAVLEFPNEDCVARWRQVGAPSLGSGIVATEADRLAHGEIFPRDSSHATFTVTAYDVKVSPERYRDYTQGYTAPEFEAMRQSGKGLTSYFLFAARDRTSAPWQALLLAEYRDPLAYSRREEMLADARLHLADQPAWKAWSDGKAAIRSERKPQLEATWELLPAPALNDLPPYKPEYRVIGTIRVLGSFLKYTTAALEEAFLRYQPDAQFANNFSTSSEGAIGGLCTGVSDLAPAGDDAKIPDQMPFYNVYGYLPLEISVATGDYEKRGALWPTVIVVNKDNPITHLTMDQLDRIFGSARLGGWSVGDNPEHNILFTSKYGRSRSTNIRTWDQLGLGGDWAGKEIQTYGYAAPGFEVYFERKVLHWTDKWNDNLLQYVEPKEAATGDTAVASDQMLEAISKDRYGIGWAASFHAKYYPNLKYLAIAPGTSSNFVDYTPENVANRTYPLTRDAYFYVNREPGRPLDPKLREFLRFILSREGQQIIAHTGFFYPLPADYLQQQLQKLN